MEEIFTINSKASFVFNERNKHWTITCYDAKGKILWGKNVGREEGNKLLLDFCCKSVGYISCKSLVDTVAICDSDGCECGYVRCHKNNKNRIDKKENLDEWFYTLLIDTLIKMEKRITIRKYVIVSSDFLNFCIYNNEENRMDDYLNMEDASGHVQNILVGYLLDYMKKEKITYARDLGREIVLNHIHMDTFNIMFASQLINEIHKLIKATEENLVKEKTESHRKFLKSSLGQELLGTLEEDSMKLARIKKEDE